MDSPTRSSWVTALAGASILLAATWTPGLADGQAVEAPDSQRDIGERFRQLYVEWRERTAAPSWRSDMAWMWELPQYRAIVAMGPRVLPYVVEQIRDEPHSTALLPALEEITGIDWRARWVMSESDRAPVAGGPLVGLCDAIAHWWAHGAPGVEAAFRDLHSDWHEEVGEGTDTVLLYTTETRLLPGYGSISQSRPVPTAAGRIYLAVEALGLAVLPVLIDAIGEGHVEWLPAVLRLTDGAPAVDPMLTAQMRAAQLREWWEADKQDWLIPWPEDDTEE